MANSKKTSINSAERVLNLVALLTESAQPLTLENIANSMRGQYPEKHEACRTAFERDKKILREVGVPITSIVLSGSDAGKTAYSINRSEYKLINFELTREEMNALQNAAAMVQIGTSWGKQAVQWLGGEIVDTESRVAARVDARAPVLPVLFAAIASLKATSFRYRNKNRIVHPYGLLARNGFWYLIAFDTERATQVTYRADRIEGEINVIEGQSFTRPENFKLSDSFVRDPKEFTGSDNEVAVVRLDSRVAPAVIRELGDEAIVAKRADGSIDVEVSCGNRVAFRSWLYAMVDRAEVISPESIRQEIISDLVRMTGAVQ